MSRTQLAAPAVLMALVLSGCGLSTRYPPSLKYPIRQDVLVTGAVMEGQPKILPSPGQLDQSIEEALRKEKRPFLDPRKLTGAERAALRAALDDKFGTPYRPAVNVPSTGSLGLDDQAQLAEGSELYRMHCMHCHGVAGDGRGPTAPWVHPHPRDYRSGFFKFISTDGKLTYRKPRRDDLTRVLMKGIDGTSMPTFNILPRKQIDALVSYVIHLSIRGEVEMKVLEENLAKPDPRPALEEKEAADKVAATAVEIVDRWRESNDAPPMEPPAYPAELVGDTREAKEAMLKSIERGHDLFVKDAGCLTCHFDYGRQSSYRYDNWGTLVRPRDLTVATYRGGRRPVDLYWRVAGGILGSGMPESAHSKIKEPKPYPPEAWWDLVNFVQALPYPNMLPEKVRQKVYGSSLKVLGKDEKWGSH